MRLSARPHTTEPSAALRPTDDWTPERTPSGLVLLMRAPWSRTQRLFKGARVLRENAPKLIGLLAPGGGGESSDGQETPIPSTRFDRPIAMRERVFDGLVLPLDDKMRDPRARRSEMRRWR